MVCETCIFKGKVSKVATPEPWKAGNSSKTAGGRPVNENKLLSSKKARFNPMSAEFPRCRICRSRCHYVKAHYCQECSYKKAICAICGKKLMNIKNYKQSSV